MLRFPAHTASRDRVRLILPLLFGVTLLAAAPATATVYYVANHGNDTADGRSPATAWQTIARVNRQAFEPGDKILLRRGDSWRESLRSASGSEQGYITYGAYGEGPKPALIGSVEMNDPRQWQHEGGNVWANVPPQPIGDQVLPNPGFDSDLARWSMHREGSANARLTRETEGCQSGAGCCQLECLQPGQGASHIQLITMPFTVEAGKVYRLTFYARANKPATLTAPSLHKAGKPWTAYTESARSQHYPIGDTWAKYTRYYRTHTTANDARLTFHLGDALPAGGVLHLDSLELVECTDNLLTCDVGNIIFDHEKCCGVKVFEPEKLDAQGKYYYDEDNQLVKIYSAKNPGEYYSDIELALRRHQISQSNCSYVIYENLAVRYGAAHGIGGGWVHHIVVRDCDFSFIGGGDQYGGERTVRFGNGVEFWGEAHDCLVERCRLWEIYDAALTNQNKGKDVHEVDITYRNNIIWNCEFSFEYWNRPETSVTRNIVFENNTCIGAGRGWSHAQRRDPGGRHLCFYTNDAQSQNIIIRNNIFFDAANNAFFARYLTPEQRKALVLDHNCWYQAEGKMILFKETSYTMDDFVRYQTEQQAEPHSFVAKPGLIDVDRRDFRLKADSPCIDRGMDVGIVRDYFGTRVPQGNAPDIGAVERLEARD